VSGLHLDAAHAALGVAFSLTLVGVAGALLSSSLFKQLAGAYVALVAVAIGAGAIGASESFVAVAVAGAMGVVLIGAGLLVRTHEAYQTLERARLDEADGHDERAEPRS